MKKHTDVFSVDHYAYQSPLKVLRPEIKLLFSAIVLGICLIAGSFWVSLYILVSMAAINCFVNKISFRNYVRLLSIPVFFLAAGCLAIAIDLGHNAGGMYLKVTKEGMEKSLQIAARTMGCVSVLYFLSLSTPLYEIIAALKRIRVPGIMTELMNMIYRYIFILMDVQTQMRQAAESRLGYCDFKTSLHTFGNSMGSLFILSLRKAGMYYNALEARCYSGQLTFLEEYQEIGKKRLFAGIFYVISIGFIYLAV